MSQAVPEAGSGPRPAMRESATGAARPAEAGAGQTGAGQAGGGQVGLNGADQRWRELLDLDARLNEQKGVRLLTPEARVLLYLTLSGPVSVTSAMQIAGTSYRGFYAVLERLRQAGLVATTKDEQDQRVRRLQLAPSLVVTGQEPRS
ncbi:MAG: MarR family winged helix-turn-helix transcriptional regulator [Novosphingobium sp.]|nr:MarR family winged helix-turn-helix transcriptional regulator [Novosphingobium sp.]